MPCRSLPPSPRESLQSYGQPNRRSISLRRYDNQAGRWQVLSDEEFAEFVQTRGPALLRTACFSAAAGTTARTCCSRRWSTPMRASVGSGSRPRSRGMSERPWSAPASRLAARPGASANGRPTPYRKHRSSTSSPRWITAMSCGLCCSSFRLSSGLSWCSATTRTSPRRRSHDSSDARQEASNGMLPAPLTACANTSPTRLPAPREERSDEPRR